MQVTGQSLINAALTELGILAQGEAPSFSDSTYGLNTLNAWWDGAQIDEGLIYSVSTLRYPLTASVGKYAIGIGAPAPFNATLPTRVVTAAMLSAAGGSNIRRVLKIVPQEVFFAHSDLGTSGQVSEEIYLDWGTDPATGLGNLYLYPVPVCALATQLELEEGVPFQQFTLAGNFFVPYGYQDAIQKILAWMMLPGFGAAVQQETVQVVIQQAKAAEDRIRKMNAANRQISREMAGLAPEATPTPAGR